VATLSATQIASYAYQAGFRGADLVIAVAVAFAESGGNPSAINTTNANGSRDYGLWQINSVHSDLLASGSWSNPADNARMAYSVWKGSGWRAWASYNSGSYRSHLSNATSAVGTGNFTLTSSPKVEFPASQYPIPILPGVSPTHYSANGHHLPYKGGFLVLGQAIPAADRSKLIAWFAHGHVDALDSFDRAKQVELAAGKGTDSEMALYYLSWSVNFHYGGGGSVSPIPSYPGQGPINDAHDALNAFVNFLRVAEFIGGGLLIIIALYRLASGSLPTPLKAVAKVVPG
jgi:hypothetical protein